MRFMALVATLVASSAIGVDAQPVAPSAGHARLAQLVGKWTLKGMEGRFRETCEWYEGRFHVVCHTENIRADGSIGRGMSILGYLPAEDAYTYHGIGARGRNVTQRGRFRDGTFEFVTPAAGDAPAIRIRLGPFGERGFPTVEEALAPDGTWTRRSSGEYVKLD